MNFDTALFNKFNNKKIDESQFILGIDLGDATTSLVYFDAFRNIPEIVDISGGYGKANIPTAVQYIPETREWVFGEYAILNTGSIDKDMVFKGIIDKLGAKSYVEIGGKLEPVVNILALYLKELLINLKNINPKAEVAGIVVSVPGYMPEEAKEELVKAFSMTGYDKKLLGLVSDRECIAAYHYFGKRVENESILILDYSGRQLRGGIYRLSQHSGTVNMETVSYLFDDSAGVNNVDDRINNKFLELYAEETESDIKSLPQSVIEQVEVFAYQHKDAIFQKNIPQKGLRLYYNFAYPPFYKVFYKEDRDTIVNPFKNRLVKFLNDLVTTHATDSDPIELSDISTVLCTGGGFEMLWARQAVEDVLPDSNVCNYKNSKAVAAYGASIISAARLGVINEKTFVICDKLKLNADIGLSVVKDGKTRFVPLFEKNSFWWQNNRKIRILINEAVNGRYSFPLIKRGESGDFITLGEITVDGFPKRPKGVTEILLHLEYISRDKIKINVKDFGFGEMFPANDINTEQILSI